MREPLLFWPLAPAEQQSARDVAVHSDGTLAQSLGGLASCGLIEIRDDHARAGVQKPAHDGGADACDSTFALVIATGDRLPDLRTTHCGRTCLCRASLYNS